MSRFTTHCRNAPLLERRLGGQLHNTWLRRATTVLLVVALLGSNLACGTSHVVPPRAYSALEQGTQYVIVTEDGTKHVLRDWAVTDETIIVYDVYDDPQNPLAEKRALPYEIRLSDVAQVTEHKVSKKKTFWVLVGAGVLTVFLVAFLRMDLSAD